MYPTTSDPFAAFDAVATATPVAPVETPVVKDDLRTKLSTLSNRTGFARTFADSMFDQLNRGKRPSDKQLALVEKLLNEAARPPRAPLTLHAGTVGVRETFEVTLDFAHGYEGAFGWQTILKFKTSTGAALVWRTGSSDLGKGDVGRSFSLTGTVKSHGEYKGDAQTIVTRCKLVAHETAEAA